MAGCRSVVHCSATSNPPSCSAISPRRAPPKQNGNEMIPVYSRKLNGTGHGNLLSRQQLGQDYLQKTNKHRNELDILSVLTFRKKTLTFRPSMQNSMQMSISSILTVRHVEPTSVQVVGWIISVHVPGQQNCTTGLLLLCSAGGRAQVPVPTVGQLSFKEMEASWEVRRHIGSL